MENRRLTDKEVKRLHEIDPYIDLKLNLSLKLISINSRAEEIAKRSKSKKLVAEVKEIPSFLGNTFKVFLKRPDEKNASICIRFDRGYKKPKIGEKESIPVPEIFVDFFLVEKPNFILKKFKNLSCRSELWESFDPYSNGPRNAWLVKNESKKAWEYGLELISYLLKYGISDKKAIKPKKIYRSSGGGGNHC